MIRLAGVLLLPIPYYLMQFDVIILSSARLMLLLMLIPWCTRVPHCTLPREKSHRTEIPPLLLTLAQSRVLRHLQKD